MLLSADGVGLVGATEAQADELLHTGSKGVEFDVAEMNIVPPSTDNLTFSISELEVPVGNP